jgi:hypothetical protein
MTDDPFLLNADLIYHTTFGDAQHAVTLSRRAASLFSAVPYDEATRALAGNASLALIRLGHYEAARDIAIDIFDRTFSKGMLSGAEYALSMVIDADICLGNFANGESWMRRWETLAARRTAYKSSYFSGYYSAKLLLALNAGRFSEAEDCIDRYREFGMLGTPRFRAIGLAHSLMIKYRRGDPSLPDRDVSELHSLYERGKTLTGQDSNVEALWCATTRRGDPEAASRLLAEYLNNYRREVLLPEASLRQVTCLDPAWLTSPYASNVAKVS